jgi:hypothetical protein
LLSGTEANAPLRTSSGSRPHILSIESKQVERVQKHPPVLAPVSQPVEHRQPIAITGHRFAVDQKRPRPQRSRRLRNQWKPTRPVVPVAGEKPHAGRVAPHHHAEAVELDLVDPAGAGRTGGDQRVKEGNAQ